MGKFWCCNSEMRSSPHEIGSSSTGLKDLYGPSPSYKFDRGAREREAEDKPTGLKMTFFLKLDYSINWNETILDLFEIWISNSKWVTLDLTWPTQLRLQELTDYSVIRHWFIFEWKKYCKNLNKFTIFLFIWYGWWGVGVEARFGKFQNCFFLLWCLP